MTDASPYVTFGAEMSPYSIKVRAYCRYKGVPHHWVVRNGSSQDEFAKVAKLPIVPAVRLPDGTGMQDSTPIMEYLDATFPASPTTHPPGEFLSFVSELLEEFGDEWGNKVSVVERF